MGDVRLYESHGFWKDVGGWPTWCAGGVVYEFGRFGSRKVMVDVSAIEELIKKVRLGC